MEAGKQPWEEQGYSHLVCAAGGPLAFDYFAGQVEVSQSISTDRRRLKRCGHLNWQISNSLPTAVCQSHCRAPIARSTHAWVEGRGGVTSTCGVPVRTLTIHTDRNTP